MGADTIRQRIVDAVMLRLRSIITGASVTMQDGDTHTYVNDLSGSVSEWKPTPTPDSGIPCANVNDLQESTIIAIGSHEHLMTTAIELYAESSEILRTLIGDVTACIGSDLTWGGLAEDTKPIGDEDISVVQKSRIIAGCRMKFLIQFTTSPWNPYKQGG